MRKPRGHKSCIFAQIYELKFQFIAVTLSKKASEPRKNVQKGNLIHLLECQFGTQKREGGLITWIPFWGRRSSWLSWWVAWWW